MLEELVRNLHDTVALSNACRLTRNVEQAVVTFRPVLDLISKTLLAPAIFFIDSTTVVLDQVAELLDDSVRCILFHRFHDKYDFVLSHEITSLFGLWLPYYEEQSYIFAFQRLNKYTTNGERMQA